jgi:ABC-2 type transport system permease protein
MSEAIVTVTEPRGPAPGRLGPLGTMAWLDLRETLRARWFQLYVLGFTSLMGLFFVFGLAESQVMGFTGLGRLLLTFIQVTLVVLPIFVLVTTARTLVGDREAGVFEYVLTLPVSLAAYYWGRLLGRTAAIALPLVLALGAGAGVERLRGGEVPWAVVIYYAGLVLALTFCFLGLAMLISVVSRTQEMAIGLAFGAWLALEALIDALLIGLLVQERAPVEGVVAVALLNPLQAFRTAAIALFDPELTILGSVSYALLDTLGQGGLLTWALAWPTALGLGAAALGALIFVRRDAL